MLCASVQVSIGLSQGPHLKAKSIQNELTLQAIPSAKLKQPLHFNSHIFCNNIRIEYDPQSMIACSKIPADRVHSATANLLASGLVMAATHRSLGIRSEFGSTVKLNNSEVLYLAVA
ncbi:hypothetical protein K4K49_002303 [Colletotrichum sp. SAR 10_70]|nr:hypothetical protein K4K50_003296 [Colletotrichum sp. SAR 10_71]KAI8176792.1 hypothetical protein K4K49_002303 [Colletotrichum sp. SAR 10_70]